MTVWDEKVSDSGWKNEVSFLKPASLIIIPRATVWKQKTKMNIMPSEIIVSLSFWVNKVLTFHKTETQWKKKKQTFMTLIFET